MIRALKSALGNIQFRGTFIKLIVAFVVLLFLISVSITFLVRMNYDQRLNQKIIDTTGLNRVEATRAFMDALLRDLDNMIVQITNNESVSSAFKRRSPTELYAALQPFGNDFRQRFMSSYGIDAVFMYMNRNGFIQMPIASSQSRLNVNVKDIFDRIDQMPKEDQWVLSGLQSDPALRNPPLILVRPLPLVGNTVEGAMIVIVDSGNFFRSPFVIGERENLWIVLPDGGSAFDAKTGSLIPAEEFTKVRGDLDRRAASFSRKQRDATEEFRVYNSSLNGWRFVFSVPVSSPWGTVNIVIVILLLAVIAVNALYVSFKAKRIHIYIHTLTSMLATRRNYLGLKPNKDDEFSVLIGQLHRILDHDEQLRERLQNQELLLKETFLRQLLWEPGIDSEERFADFEKHQLPASRFGFIVLTVRIDDIPGFVSRYNEGDQELIRYFIGKLIEEHLTDHTYVYRLEQGHDLVLICNPVRKMNLSHIRSFMVSQLNASTQLVHEYLGFTVTVGIGDFHPDVGMVSESYNQALQALELKLLKGRGTVIPIWHAAPNQYAIMNLYEERKLAEKEILQALQQGDYERFTACLDRFAVVLHEQEGGTHALLHHTAWELAMSIHHAIGPTSGVPLGAMYDTLGMQESLEGMMNELKLIIRSLVQERASTESSEGGVNLIQHILDYIEANHNKEISLNNIADKLDMDPSYLSRLFKQEVGMNFMDYLLKLRMKRARLLLSSTPYTVNEISQMVGYYTPASFIRVFKKLEGVPPGQYRLEHTVKNLGTDGLR